MEVLSTMKATDKDKLGIGGQSKFMKIRCPF
jgi:hypothetical protein